MPAACGRNIVCICWCWVATAVVCRRGQRSGGLFRSTQKWSAAIASKLQRPRRCWQTLRENGGMQRPIDVPTFGVRPHPGASSTAVSSRMSALGVRDTTPELQVRRAMHRMGMRYRVCYPIPGRPRRSIDIAFTRWRVAVYVDGCFWHGCPAHGTLPTANAQWWAEKLVANTDRDRDSDMWLAANGWRVVRVWEHESVLDVIAKVVETLRESGYPDSA